jgi:hypothetical protein
MTAPKAPLRNLFEGMNKTEQARALDLEAMKRNGFILEWWYERWTFKLADDTRYTPDFIVQMPDGTLEVEEVKGFWREDARVKVKVFASLYPFRVRGFSRTKAGSSWDVETFKP